MNPLEAMNVKKNPSSFSNNHCSQCDQVWCAFACRDKKSTREWDLSRMCQNCQDEFFDNSQTKYPMKKELPREKPEDLSEQLEMLQDRFERMEESFRITKFLLSHPYPSFEEMEKRVSPELRYQKGTHELCKMLYQNWFNINLIRAIGEKLYSIGGSDEMRRILYAMGSSPTQASRDFVVRGAWIIMARKWDGIGDWRN